MILVNGKMIPEEAIVFALHSLGLLDDSTELSACVKDGNAQKERMVKIERDGSPCVHFAVPECCDVRVAVCTKDGIMTAVANDEKPWNRLDIDLINPEETQLGRRSYGVALASLENPDEAPETEGEDRCLKMYVFSDLGREECTEEIFYKNIEMVLNEE